VIGVATAAVPALAQAEPHRPAERQVSSFPICRR
jgi:hypothetical protein